MKLDNFYGFNKEFQNENFSLFFVFLKLINGRENNVTFQVLKKLNNINLKKR